MTRRSVIVLFCVGMAGPVGMSVLMELDESCVDHGLQVAMDMLRGIRIGEMGSCEQVEASR
jgi:hypothetical protein